VEGEGMNKLKYTKSESELRIKILERVKHLYNVVPSDLQELVTEVNTDEVMFLIREYIEELK
jgi:hypothetical protein